MRSVLNVSTPSGPGRRRFEPDPVTGRVIRRIPSTVEPGRLAGPRVGRRRRSSVPPQELAEYRLARRLHVPEPGLLGVLPPPAQRRRRDEGPHGPKVDRLGAHGLEQPGDLLIGVADQRLEPDLVIAIPHAEEIRESPEVVEDLVRMPVPPVVEERE